MSRTMYNMKNSILLSDLAPAAVVIVVAMTAALPAYLTLSRAKPGRARSAICLSPGVLRRPAGDDCARRNAGAAGRAGDANRRDRHARVLHRAVHRHGARQARPAAAAPAAARGEHAAGLHALTLRGYRCFSRRREGLARHGIPMAEVDGSAPDAARHLCDHRPARVPVPGLHPPASLRGRGLRGEPGERSGVVGDLAGRIGSATTCCSEALTEKLPGLPFAQPNQTRAMRSAAWRMRGTWRSQALSVRRGSGPCTPTAAMTMPLASMTGTAVPTMPSMRSWSLSA